ncbi:MAG: hypothetical protein HPY45_05560 [Anaerolineae bacterium]|nr:hypothetical protein [Anaerolineae bacterium]
MSDLIIVSGGRGVGKTTFCRTVVKSAQHAGWRVAGVLSPAVFERGSKVAIAVEDISSGERRMLARLPVAGVAEGGIRTPGWVFDEQTLQWADEALARVASCDLLVVDELGPLEIERGQGWVHGLTALDKGEYRLALVVVRPELVGIARQHWRQAECIELKHQQDISNALEQVTRYWRQNDINF